MYLSEPQVRLVTSIFLCDVSGCVFHNFLSFVVLSNAVIHLHKSLGRFLTIFLSLYCHVNIKFSKHFLYYVPEIQPSPDFKYNSPFCFHFPWNFLPWYYQHPSVEYFCWPKFPLHVWKLSSIHRHIGLILHCSSAIFCISNRIFLIHCLALERHFLLFQCAFSFQYFLDFVIFNL